MPYRKRSVIEIREVLRRFCLGEGLRAIAHGTGSDRKTVAKYVAAAPAVGLRRGDPGPSDSFTSTPPVQLHGMPLRLVFAVRAATGITGRRPRRLPRRATSVAPFVHVVRSRLSIKKFFHLVPCVSVFFDFFEMIANDLAPCVLGVVNFLNVENRQHIKF